MIRLVLAEGGRFPDLAATYRRVVIDPALAAIRRLAAAAVASGELRGDALLRVPHLMAGPLVVPVLWNGIFAAGDGVEGEVVFEAWLEVVFG